MQKFEQSKTYNILENIMVLLLGLWFISMIISIWNHNFLLGILLIPLAFIIHLISKIFDKQPKYSKEFINYIINKIDNALTLEQFEYILSEFEELAIKNGMYNLCYPIDLKKIHNNIIAKINILSKLKNNSQEYILCAANYYDDGKEHAHTCKNIKTGFVICGRRHHNCISTFALMVGFPYDEYGLKLSNTEDQGFITNTDRFVTRLQALEIAKNANQLKPDENVNERLGLFSENLY